MTFLLAAALEKVSGGKAGLLCVLTPASGMLCHLHPPNLLVSVNCESYLAVHQWALGEITE